ncbi:MAG: PCYCGC motif-containing (lipo)protein [Kyrpidia sp.]|nr:PCYCGC motif-containing (lipo)protein [Kyrpidia sp.]
MRRFFGTGLWVASAFSLAFALLATGCGTTAQAGGPSRKALEAAAEEAKTIRVPLPDYVTSRPAEVQDLYRLAYAHPDALRYMPCYCGCVNEGHQSDLDCFVRGINADGSVRWDPMGQGCGICLNIARDAVAMQKDGKSLQQIRTYIEQTYSRFGPATRTPSPPQS